MPGDAVRIKKPASGWWAFDEKALPDGSLGIIQGSVGVAQTDYSIVFRHRTFRDEHVVESGGGPGSISTPAAELVQTGETVEVVCWRWKDGVPRAQNGVEYAILPLWEWAPPHVKAPSAPRTPRPHVL
jgi:hypothetical protein